MTVLEPWQLGSFSTKGSSLKPAPFRYFAPADFDEAVHLMGEYAEDARPLAGGQSLVALMNTRLLQPSVLIDLGRCSGVDQMVESGDSITIPSMLRQASAEHSPLIREKCPLISAALPHVGATAHRNRGTVCGSLAHADPLAELPCVAVALDAEFTVARVAGRRKVPASEFFFGALSTALEPDELLEAVTFPKAGPRTRAAFVEVGRNRLHGFALVGVGAQVEFDAEGRCDSARIAVMGVGDAPMRMLEVEAALTGRWLVDATIADVGNDIGVEFDVRSDIHASAEYRTAIVRTLIRQALTQIEAQRGVQA